MDNVINLEEKKSALLKKKNDAMIKEAELKRKEQLILDISNIIWLISNDEITNVDMIFTFRDKDCYYGFRDDIEREDLKNRADNIYKQIKFE